MTKWLMNTLRGNSYLNNSDIKKEAAFDAQDGLVVEENVPTVVEQKLLDYYQSIAFRLKADNTKEFNTVLSSNDANKIDTFISRYAEEEDRIIKGAQAASNTYRREYYKTLANKSKVGLTLDVYDHMYRYFELPKEIGSLADYNAAIQAKEDAIVIKAKRRGVPECIKTFEDKSAKLAQETLNTFYQKSEKLQELIEKHVQKSLTDSQLQNKIKILKSHEQDLISKIYHSIFLYKNVLSQELLKTDIRIENSESIDLRSKLCLFYDVNIDISSIEELNIVEKAQNDAINNISLFQIDGSFSSYELFMRDQYQSKIDEYYKLHGMQYRYLEDEEYLTQEETNTDEVNHNHYNPVIVEQGMIYENQVQSLFTKLVNLYRSEYLRINKQSSENPQIIAKLNLQPVLKFYFKNIENETLNIQDINNAATEDAALSENTLDTATAYMYYIQKKYQKLVEQNYKEYSVKLQELKSNSTKNRRDEVNSLITLYKKEETQCQNQYEEFQLIYIREFINRKHTQGAEIYASKESDYSNIIPSLALYFTDMHEQKVAIIDEDIVAMAQADAANNIALKVFPDFTYNEKSIRNIYQQLHSELSIDAAGMVGETNAYAKSVETDYRSKIDKYREAYISSSQEAPADSRLFQFGYLPLEGLEVSEETYLPSNFTLLDITQAVIIDVINGVKSCNFIKNLISEYQFCAEQNYKKFLQTGEAKVEVITGMMVDDTNTTNYHEYSSKESLILQDMQKVISKYIELYEIYSKAVNSTHDCDFDKCMTPVELYFDTDVTEEKTIRQAQLDSKMNIVKAPTSYQKKISVFFRRKLFEVKIAYIESMRVARNDYVDSGDKNQLNTLREKEALEKEMIVAEYQQIMNLYLSENSAIKNYEIPDLV